MIFFLILLQNPHITMLYYAIYTLLSSTTSPDNLHPPLSAATLSNTLFVLHSLTLLGTSDQV